MEKIIQQKDTYQIIGICMEVHRILGFGFSEIVYKDAIEIEGALKDVPVHREKNLTFTTKEKNYGINTLLISLCLII